MPSFEFRNSTSLLVGIELEMQLMNLAGHDLVRAAPQLLDHMRGSRFAERIRPEITQAMIEINSAVNTSCEDLHTEMLQVRDELAARCRDMGVLIAGGGCHPFQKWADRRIFPVERFERLFETYGYLAMQFTVFGLHVHIGCPSGDMALYLAHRLARYVPHFIAMSASSPFFEGQDTGYQCSRLNAVSSFPLSGSMPFFTKWDDLVKHLETLRSYGVAESLKDFYWDIRPKPEYGTIEVRVFDTPLTVEKACALAAYTQALADYLMSENVVSPDPRVYDLYRYNRFQACRYGFEGRFVDVAAGESRNLREDILQTFDAMVSHYGRFGASELISRLREDVAAGRSDADWLRAVYRESGSLAEVARRQAARWMGDEHAGASAAGQAQRGWE